MRRLKLRHRTSRCERGQYINATSAEAWKMLYYAELFNVKK
jgi:hypothetical protein